MLKERKQLVEVFFVIFDLFFIAVAWVLAYYLRFYSGIIPVDKGIPPFSQYFWFLKQRIFESTLKELSVSSFK